MHQSHTCQWKMLTFFSKASKESMSFWKIVIFIKSISYDTSDLLSKKYFIMLILFVEGRILNPKRVTRLSLMKCIKISVEKQTQASIVIWIIILPSVFWSFSIEKRSHKPLSFADRQIQASLHFQQTLSIEMWPPLSLLLRNEKLAWLGHPVTGSIYRGSNQTVNDDVKGKTSDSFTHNQMDFHWRENHIELWVHIYCSVKKWKEAIIVICIIFLPSVFWIFLIETRSNKSLSFVGNKYRLVYTFNKHCLLKCHPHHAFGSGMKL